MLPAHLENAFIDALYDNHVVTKNINTAPTGFITPSGNIIDTSDIDDHGEAILYAFDVAKIKRDPSIWDQRYVDYVVEKFNLVRFRQDSIRFVDLPSKSTKKQFNSIKQLVKKSLDEQEEFIVGVALSSELSKAFDPKTSSETEILRAVRMLAKVE